MDLIEILIEYFTYLVKLFANKKHLLLCLVIFEYSDCICIFEKYYEYQTISGTFATK